MWPFLKIAARGGGGGESELDAWIERLEAEETVSLSLAQPSWTGSYVVPEGIAAVRFSLRKSPGSRMHLLLMDEGSGLRLGFLATEGREVRELPGAYTGPLGEREAITLGASPGTRLAIEVALAGPPQADEETAWLAILAEPQRPAILGVEPAAVEVYRKPGDPVRLTLRLAEIGRQAPFNLVRAEVMPLVGPGGASVLPTEGRLTEIRPLSPGQEVTVEARFVVPADAPGVHEGSLQILADESISETIPVAVYVDGEAPETELVEVPPGLGNGKEVRLAWTGTDNFAPERLLFQTRLDGLDSDWSAPSARRAFSYDRLPPGEYTFNVRAADLAGNVDLTPATVRFEARPFFRRADADSSGQHDISDSIFLLNHLFLGGSAPLCMKAADANDDGAADISDAVYFLGYLFLGGPAPAAPYPDCGTESTEDPLGCEDYPGC